VKIILAPASFRAAPRPMGPVADVAGREGLLLAIAEFRSTANEANIALSFKALSDILASTAGWMPASPNGCLPRDQVGRKAKASSGFGRRL
jgi:hypothetical protein